jgi:hypothetical protein
MHGPPSNPISRTLTILLPSIGNMIFVAILLVLVFNTADGLLGDQDIVKPDHAVELTRLIPGARLLILPGGHGDYLGELVMTQRETRYPELTVGLIEEFLNAPSR